MEDRMLRIPDATGDIVLKAVPGDFATSHAHTNFLVNTFGYPKL